ncbi:hypothetical protein ANCCAN_01182 [Ancylostoma caninum]|uniref:Uncharacterized protein n=1 Tax=Ancylostoma caninum TaxID=29170 RepID=A0A368HC36_ANCCA|nr:hypothetical protein ANCCAN_01182 [Ancylostoma caninum]
MVKLANKYNKQGKHDIEALVHQNIEMALQEARQRTRIHADHFGSQKYKPPPGIWEILASQYGPGFVMETMKCGGTPLYDENDELERRNTERGILHCIQVAL